MGEVERMRVIPNNISLAVKISENAGDSRSVRVTSHVCLVLVVIRQKINGVHDSIRVC